MENMYLFVQAGFVVLTVLFFGLLLRELHVALSTTPFEISRKKKILRNTILSLIAWAVLVSTLSISGVLSDFTTLPPKLFIVLIVPLVTVIWILRSETLREILVHVPAESLIRLQVFRVFVEVLLWMLFVDNLLPEQMTFEGYNFDILAGLTAPFVGYFVSRKKLSNTWIIVWNFVCLGLLINIVGTAILSLPTPFRVFMNEPANTIVAKFPIVFLPAFLVPLAYGLHFLSLKKIFIHMNRSPSVA
jgi:hypothetical protein